MNNQRGFTAIELLVAMFVVFGVVIFGGLLYVLYHFISKFW